MKIKFTEKNSIFDRSNKLLKGIVYTDIVDEESFLYIKSRFKDPWYNFVIPVTSSNKLDWDRAGEVIKKAKDNDNIEMSFYIHDSLVSDYEKTLTQKGYEDFGTDLYMHLKINKPFDDVQGDFINLDKADYEEYLEATVKCFPDWENEKKYSEYFFSLTKNPSEVIHSTVLLKENNKLVSFGSMAISKELKLSYLHNLGTLKEYRNKGLATTIIKYFCNMALENGVDEMYGLLEYGGASYYCLKGLGFEPKENFRLFVNK